MHIHILGDSKLWKNGLQEMVMVMRRPRRAADSCPKRAGERMIVSRPPSE